MCYTITTLQFRTHTLLFSCWFCFQSLIVVLSVWLQSLIDYSWDGTSYWQQGILETSLENSLFLAQFCQSFDRYPNVGLFVLTEFLILLRVTPMFGEPTACRGKKSHISDPSLEKCALFSARLPVYIHSEDVANWLRLERLFLTI